jgi:hypothetical protein
MYLHLSHRKESTKWWSPGPVGDGAEADQAAIEARVEAEAGRGLPGHRETALKIMGAPEAPCH